MKKSKFFGAVILMVSMLMFSSMAFATPGASILYWETDNLDETWTYDYVFINTSDAGEFLYNVYLEFDGSMHTITGSPLPGNWEGTVWVGTNETTYLDTYSTGPDYDIPSVGGNSKRWFSFVIDYRAGNIPYTAYFDDHSGGFSETTGMTALAPEPISSILFLSGGAALIFGRRLKRKQITV